MYGFDLLLTLSVQAIALVGFGSILVIPDDLSLGYHQCQRPSTSKGIRQYIPDYASFIVH